MYLVFAVFSVLSCQDDKDANGRIADQWLSRVRHVNVEQADGYHADVYDSGAYSVIVCSSAVYASY